MANKALDYVFKNSKMKGSALLLLVAIADAINKDGVTWPSVPTLAAKVRMTPRHVQRLLHELEAAGELIVQERKGSSCRYYIPGPWHDVDIKSIREFTPQPRPFRPQKRVIEAATDIPTAAARGDTGVTPEYDSGVAPAIEARGDSGVTQEVTQGSPLSTTQESPIPVTVPSSNPKTTDAHSAPAKFEPTDALQNEPFTPPASAPKQPAAPPPKRTRKATAAKPKADTPAPAKKPRAKRPPKARKDGAPTVPRAQLDAMADAIRASFYGEAPVTRPINGIVYATARDLCLAGIESDEVDGLYRNAKKMDWPDFTPRVLSTRLPDLLGGAPAGRKPRPTVHDDDIAWGTAEEAMTPVVYFDVPEHLREAVGPVEYGGVR